MKKINFLFLGPLLFFSAGTFAHDYPTIETVRFVVECMAELGEQNEENLYTCTCRHDVVADILPFEQFEQASFFKRYSRMPGKRGGLVRDNESADKLVSDFDAAYETANQQCPTVKHIKPAKEKQ